MKKITLLLLLLTASFSFAQEVFSEDFETSLGLPTGWTNNDIAGNGEIWTFNNTGSAALITDPNTNVYTAGGAIGNYAEFDSDTYGDNGTAENAALESPVFDASALTSVFIEYNYYFAGNFGGTGFVEVTTDGTTWTTIETYSGDNYQGGLATLDATSQLAGATSAQIRFRWTGNWSVAFYFDNVSVFQCTETAAPSCVTEITPVDGEMSAGTGNGTDISVTFDWNTDPLATSYELFINGNSQGASTPGVVYTGFTTSTAYTWSVVPSNCFGAATGCPTWNFTTQPTLGVDDFEKIATISVYPNPTNDIVNIKTDLAIDSIEVINMLGQTVKKFNSVTNNTVSIASLRNGVYFLNINAQGKTQTIRIIKK